jgi:hypothetical protein
MCYTLEDFISLHNVNEINLPVLKVLREIEKKHNLSLLHSIHVVYVGEKMVKDTATSQQFSTNSSWHFEMLNTDPLLSSSLIRDIQILLPALHLVESFTK